MRKILLLGLACILPAGLAVPARADYKSMSVPKLTNLLANSNPEIRLRACRELGMRGRGAAEAVEALARAFRDLDKDVRLHAGRALAQIGLPAVPFLIKELENPDSPYLVRAALCLALIGPEASDAIAALGGCLKNKDAQVRAMAAYALGEIGPGAWRAAPALTLLLDDRTTEVKKQSRSALAAIGHRALPALRGALKSSQPGIRQQAAELIALGGELAQEAVPDLILLLEDKQPTVRQSAALALGAVARDTKKALPALIELTEDSTPAVRRAAAVALGNLGSDSEAGIPSLIKLLRDPAAPVRLQAALALIKIGFPAVGPLVRAMPKEHMMVRLGGIQVLGEIGPDARQAVPFLVENVNHPLPLVRGSAAQALGKIGPDGAGKAVEPLKKLVKRETEPAVRLSFRLALVQLQPGEPQAMIELTTEAANLILASNLVLLRKMAMGSTRPRSLLEINNQIKIQGVLDFYVYRNSFRFGDGLDNWSNAVMNQLGPEAIPPMVDTLNREVAAGGLEGYIWNGMAVLKQPPKMMGKSVFFH